MKPVRILFWAVLITFISACSKSESGTPAGNSGNNNNTTPEYYFSCKVNGSPMDFTATTLAKDDPSNFRTMYLIGQASLTSYPSITFTLNYRSPGWKSGLNYVLDENDFVNKVEYLDKTFQTFKSTATPSSPNTGIRIQFNEFDITDKQVVSGTFNGTMQVEENMTTISITEGKFRLKFLN